MSAERSPRLAGRLARAKRRMLRRHLVRRGIGDRRVLRAMESVPREEFVTRACAARAYDDEALPIGMDQTISQPYVVAFMAQALELAPGDRVLEVGAGSGYAAAVLSRLCKTVCTVERHEALAAGARARLEALGYGNVRVRCGDGAEGWPEHAPYDAVSVAAAAREVPEALRGQLAPGGRLVMPVGSRRGGQTLVRERRGADGAVERDELARVRFVPLVAGPARRG